jgi:hypothetical protein
LGLDGSDVIRRRFNTVAESGGKTWRKKIGRPVVPVHSTVMIPVMHNIIVSRSERWLNELEPDDR